MAVTGYLRWYAGLGHLNGDDIADSRKFLWKVYRQQLEAAEAGMRRLVAAGENAAAFWLMSFMYLMMCERCSRLLASLCWSFV